MNAEELLRNYLNAAYQWGIEDIVKVMVPKDFYEQLKDCGVINDNRFKYKGSIIEMRAYEEKSIQIKGSKHTVNLPLLL